MAEHYVALLRQHEPALVRSFVDIVYTDRRTDLPALLSYHQLVDYLPDIFDELAQVLDSAALDSEIAEAVRSLRMHSQARFQQGCLIDEVARELMLLRSTLWEFLRQEARRASDEDARALRDARAQLCSYAERAGVAARRSRTPSTPESGCTFEK